MIHIKYIFLLVLALAAVLVSAGFNMSICMWGRTKSLAAYGVHLSVVVAFVWAALVVYYWVSVVRKRRKGEQWDTPFN